MDLSNRTNLPQSVINLAMFAGYESKGDISVTRLIKPPRIVTLYERHKHEIQQDIQDLAWSILGQATHAMLERAAGGDVIVETRLHTQIYGWDVNGQPDAYHPKLKRLEDYKVTSVWSFLLTAKMEWEAQLNLNAMLHRLNGQEVDELAIVAFLRDWQRTKAVYDLRYPQNQIHVIGQPVWDHDKVIDFAEERVALHQDARQLPDEELPLCSPSERWFRPGVVKVYKNGNKKADKKFPDVEAANRYIAAEAIKLKAGRYFLPPQEEPGENIRCQSYCEARHFCSFAKSLVNENKPESEEEED